MEQTSSDLALVCALPKVGHPTIPYRSRCHIGCRSYKPGTPGEVTLEFPDVTREHLSEPDEDAGIDWQGEETRSPSSVSRFHIRFDRLSLQTTSMARVI